MQMIFTVEGSDEKHNSNSNPHQMSYRYSPGDAKNKDFTNFHPEHALKHNLQ